MKNSSKIEEIDYPLGRREIEQIVPYSADWLLVDRVLSCEPNLGIRVEKTISVFDPYVTGHFRNGPAIFPGVLLVEFVSQAAYLLGRISARESPSSSRPKLLAKCSATFLSPARGGDILVAEIRLADTVKDFSVYEAEVSSSSAVVCRVSIFACPFRNELQLLANGEFK
jgi:3-hydroxyacyl-[acyl-carrier-protein] dehydratase